jgi:Cof subfamily protein (haloacid dehalogenase superfamily)
MAEIKLIATDIDGTILKYNFQFNPEIKDYIKNLTEEGVKVILVTGRMHDATISIAQDLGLDINPVVSYQGGLVKLGEEVLYVRYINPEPAREIINWAKKNNVHLNLYMEDKLYVEHDSEAVRRYTGERGSGFIVKSFDEIKLENVNKLLVVDFEDENKINMWKDYLTNRFPELYFVKSMPYFCEVCHPEATKFHAVDFLREYYGLEQENILAIGDQNNDIDLLRAGGIKIAMGNATEDLKEVADYVTDTVNNNGFIKAVDKFVYNNVKV